MKKLLLLLGVVLLFNTKTFSQGWEKVLLKNNIKPPEVSSLSVNLSYDKVDLSTGRIRPSIPFFSIGTNDLQDQVSLDYISGSGIRVNDYASDVGLGWDLNLGGYIVREVRGVPDDALIWPNGVPDYQQGDPLPSAELINGQSMLNGWLDYANWSGVISPHPDDPFILHQFSFGYPINPINNNTVGNEINNFIKNYKNGVIDHIRRRPSFMASLSMDLSDLSAAGVLLDVMMDGQPDIFHYKCPGGHSGKFIFDENGEPTPIPYNPNVKISAPIGPNANSEGKWIITIGNGTKFHFPNNTNYYEKTRTETTNYPYIDDWRGPTPDRDESIFVSEYVSKWYISKAESIKGNTLEYSYLGEPNFESETKASVQQDFHVPGSFETGQTTPPPSVAFEYGSTTSRTTPRDRKEIVSHKKRLNAIYCSSGSKIILSYNGINREDVTNQKKALGSISLKNIHNSEIEKYIFNQNHFIRNISIKKLDKRLKLNGISKQEKDGTIHNDFYKFNYIVNTYNDDGSYTQNALPARNSTSQDFWGYYNDNSEGTLIPAINGEDGYIRSFPGADRSPNEEKTKAYILKEITLPTGGSIEYDYELNNFKSTLPTSIADYKKVPTGGLRIKTIIEKEGNNLPIVKNFTYILPNASDTSSGEIPEHLRKWQRNGAGRLFDKSTRYYWYDSPKAAKYITRYSYLKYLQSSDLIRYSHVSVAINGNGKSVYQMTAFNDYPDTEKTRVKWEVPNYSWGINEQPDLSVIYASENFTTYNEYGGIPGDRSPSPPISLTDKSYLRGLVLNIKEYKEGHSVPIRETTNNYTVNPNGFDVRKIYALDSNAPWEFFGESQDFLYFNLNSLNFDISSHDLDIILLDKKEIKEVYQDNNLIETSHEYFYDTEFNVVKEEKLIDSDQSELRIKRYYPFDSEVSSAPFMTDLVNQNRSTEQILVENYKDDLLLFKKRTIYDEYTLANGRLSILPKELQKSKGSNSLERELTIHKYDDAGNPLEISKKDGTRVVYIWGYNKTQLIAKIENASYFDVQNQVSNLQTLSNNDNDRTIDTKNSLGNVITYNGKEGKLREALQDLRNALPNAQVTTYTYDPLIGVTSMTDPRGETIYYTYDTFNRLEFVKDADGNILTNNQYNYKN